MVRNILFICTGNTCRSPLAEGLMRQLAKREGMQLEIRSAGISAVDGLPVSAHSSALLKAKGAGHAGPSKSVTAELAAEADLILTMTQSHKRLLLQRFPQAADKAYTLKEFAEDDPRTLAVLEEWQRLAADLQMRQALGGPVEARERDRLRELEQAVPDYDISDPFGGSLEEYRKVAEEIERSLEKLVRKLKNRP